MRPFRLLHTFCSAGGADALAGGAAPLTAAHLLHDVVHALQLGLNLGVDVLATKHAATLGRQAQSPVHRGPAFARVDRGTGEQLAHVLGEGAELLLRRVEVRRYAHVDR